MSVCVTCGELDGHDSACPYHDDDVIESLRQQLATLKEQNAMLTVQVQTVYAALELLHEHASLYLGAYHEGQNVYDSSMEALTNITALTALPQQVKSEDARDAKTLDRSEIMRLAKLSGFYVDQDNPTNEYGVTWYSGTVATLQNFAAHVAAISAQEPKG